jgi:hypothetical protein
MVWDNLMANPLVQKIVDMLKNGGKIPPEHTGKMILTVDFSQGGINKAELAVTETMK